MKLETKITGLDKVTPLLANFSKVVMKRVVRKVSKKAADPLVSALGQEVVTDGLVDTGNLAASFGYSSRFKNGNLILSIGPVNYSNLTSKQKKKRRMLRSAFYMKFLEMGTRSGNHLVARHLMQRVARREQEQLIARYVDAMGIYANEEINKLKVSK